MQYVQQSQPVQPAQQVQQERGITGAAIGGVTGALLGSSIGRGNDKTAASAALGILGAIVGDRIQNQPAQAAPQPVQI